MPKSSDYICFSINADTLKIVQVKGQGPSARVSQLFSKNIKGVSEVELPRVIESGLKGFASKSANIIAIVPPSITTTKNIEIPSTNDQEIQSIVNLQASRHTPFSREEIQIGYVNIGVYKSNYTKVLLAIANRVQLKDQIKNLERAGLKVSKVVFGPEAMAELMGRSRVLKNVSGPVAVIDIDKSATNFVIVSKGRALTSRSIPVGRADLRQDAAGAQAKILDELQKTYDAYVTEDIDQAPGQYFITHQDQHAQELQAAIKSQLQWEAVIVPYTDMIKVPKGVASAIATDYSDVSFFDVLAAAAMVSETRINLVPEEVQLQKSIEEQRNQVLQTAVLCIVGLFLASCIFGLKLYFKKAYLKNMVEQYEDTSFQVKALEKKSARTQLIRDYVETRMVSLDSIHELYRNIPDDVYLTRIGMEEDGIVNVQGISEVGSRVYNLNTTLKEVELFKNAEVKSKKSKKDRGKDAHAFEISLNLLSAGDPSDNSEPIEQQ